MATTVNLLAADNKTSERFLPTRAVFIGPNRRRIVRFMRDQSILVRNGHAVAFNGGGSAARRRLSGSIVGNSPSPVLTTEQRVIRAYMTLFVIPAGDGGSKIVSLARFGPYEVRLCEPPHDIAVETLPLWIELYAHDRRAVLDRYGCDELESAVSAADAFMSRARRLNEAAFGSNGNALTSVVPARKIQTDA